MTPGQPETFWAKVKVGAQDECWLWTMSIGSHGYGQTSYGGKRVRTAHRLAYELTHGPLPAGMHVLHNCDERRCCNPAHMRLGTNEENIADKVARGRTHSTSKLTAAQVAEIKARVEAGEVQAALAREFGVQDSTIVRIKRGQMRGRLDPSGTPIHTAEGARA